MNMNADIWLNPVCALGQIPGLVDNLWTRGDEGRRAVTRFNLVMHLTFANNIVLQITTDNKSQKTNFPYGWATFHPC